MGRALAWVLPRAGAARFVPDGVAGLACSMGQGAGGGPWLLAGGGVYAVTSFTFRGLAGLVWAPPLGATARALYDAVQRVAVPAESVRRR